MNSKNEKGEKFNPSKFHRKNADYAGTANYSEGGRSWTFEVLNTVITLDTYQFFSTPIFVSEKV
jgi:hypothetical protein